MLFELVITVTLDGGRGLCQVGILEWIRMKSWI